MNSASHRQLAAETEAYETALKRALEDLVEAQVEASAVRERVQTAEARIAELKQLVASLMSVLPKDRSSQYVGRIDDAVAKPATAGRAGPVHDNVIALFAKAGPRHWSTAEVQEELSKEGRGADPKAVLNVLNYLARKGRLRRVGRGQYFVSDLGFAVQLGDDIPSVEDGECS